MEASEGSHSLLRYTRFIQEIGVDVDEYGWPIKNKVTPVETAKALGWSPAYDAANRF